MIYLNDSSRYNENTTLIMGVFKDHLSDCVKEFDRALDGTVGQMIQTQEIKTEIGSIKTIYTFGKYFNKKVALIGLGEFDQFSKENLEEALKKVNADLGKEIALCGCCFTNNLVSVKDFVETSVEVIDYYNYEYLECKSKKDIKEFNVNILVEGQLETFSRSMHLNTAIKNTRDLVNKPYNYLDVNGIVAYAENLSKELTSYGDVTIRVYSKQECQELKMGAFLGVNQGSSVDAKMITMKYTGNQKDNQVFGLVGKGVMFDTGGYSIKQSMNTMKCDMGGAATVLGVFETVVKQKLPINIQLIIAATDNKIDGYAYVPDDVLTAMNGKTIEIVSTDAEGRLTLADALTFIQKQGVKQIIDVATLTGAVVVALGDYTTGVFGNNDEMINTFVEASKITRESAWPMPITKHIEKQVRGSKVADLTNSTGRSMGASGAAAFLKEFIEEGTSWIHLDIAGTAFHISPSNGEYYGATGAMVKTIFKYLEK
jgi:leucyl aminopeptidase